MLPLVLALTLTRSCASTVPVAYTASMALPLTAGVTVTSRGSKRFWATNARTANTTAPNTKRRARLRKKLVWFGAGTIAPYRDGIARRKPPGRGSRASFSLPLRAMTDVLTELLELLELERIEVNLFRGKSQDLGWGNVFGGQVVGQALSAAAQTVPEDRAVHSVHGYFLRTGNAKKPIVYDVDRIRDGKSFTTRRVVAIQDGSADLHDGGVVPTRGARLRSSSGGARDAGAGGLLSEVGLARKYIDRIPEAFREQATCERPIEVRPIDPVNVLAPEGDAPEARALVSRHRKAPRQAERAPLPARLRFGFQLARRGHAAARGLVADAQHAGREPRPRDLVPQAVPHGRVAALRDRQPFGERARASRGQLFTQDGRLVASTAQEGLDAAARKTLTRPAGGEADDRPRADRAPHAGEARSCYAFRVQRALRLASYEDLLRLPDDARAEILGGEVVVSPAPLPRHAKAQGALAHFIGAPFDHDDGRGGPGGWWILLEVDVRLSPHDVVRPDLAGWRRERLLDPWDMRPIDVTPDWICEVVSPSNAATDRVKKRRLYAKHGVRHYWIVDPVERTLEAVRLEGDTWIEVGSYDDAAVARIAPFEAVELAIERLFPPRAAPSPSG